MTTIAKILQQIYPLQKYSVVIANGKFPKSPYLRQLITAGTMIICCDGAINKLLNHKITPNLVIGDCDSLNNKVKHKFQSKIIRIAEQNSNDLTKAINHASRLKLDNIIILGATGLREDHTIANIGLLLEYKKLIRDIAIISDNGIFTVHDNTSEITTMVGQQISFFTTNSNTAFSCKELKWPLSNYQIRDWHQGTLNHAVTNKITLVSNGAIIVYRAFTIKRF